MTISAPHNPALAPSNDYCTQLVRAQAVNFRYAMRLIPAAKRAGMYALYAWMRLVDDIADDADGRSIPQREDDLETWRIKTHAAIDGRLDDTVTPSIWPAVHDMVRRHNIPRHVFDDAIEGQRQDLAGARFDTFDQVHAYCLRVAGTVGVASIHIWGFDGDPATVEMAKDRGVAFQLTNILRDLKEDIGRGRMYLPADERDRMGVRQQDMQAGHATAAFNDFMNMQIQRAQDYYRRSAPLESRISRDCRPALVAMTRIYHGLLRKIIAAPQAVLRRRVSLSPLEKIWIAARAVLSS